MNPEQSPKQRAEDLAREKTQQARQKAEEFKAEASAQAQQTKHEAKEVAERSRDELAEVARQQKSRISHLLGDVGEALHQAADKLRQEQDPQMADYADQAAKGLDDFSQSLSGKDFGQLRHNAEDFARRRPEAFLTASFVGGVLLGRFLRSSGTHQERQIEPGLSTGQAEVEPPSSQSGPGIPPSRRVA